MGLENKHSVRCHGRQGSDKHRPQPQWLTQTMGLGRMMSKYGPSRVGPEHGGYGSHDLGECEAGNILL